VSDPSLGVFEWMIIVSTLVSLTSILGFGLVLHLLERSRARRLELQAIQDQARAYVEQREARLAATSEVPAFKSGEAVEAIAELAHDQWVEWTSALIASSTWPERRALHRRLRDWRSTWVPYATLPEQSREADRRRARAVLAALDATRKRPLPPRGATGDSS
jgi:hypothetical protein